jgi:hypothetical protein
MPRAFISYHHANDQHFKDGLVKFAAQHRIFEDWSVNTGEISDDLSDDAIREKIRDDYLKDSSVTILLVGLETAKRKHVDWELYSSMFNGKVNKQSGILVINLPTINCSYYTAAHGDLEKRTIYPENADWTSIETKAGYQERYPYMPPRILDNLLAPKAKISVVNWSKIQNDPQKLAFLIETTYSDRTKCEYDLSKPMQRRNL